MNTKQPWNEFPEHSGWQQLIDVIADFSERNKLPLFQVKQKFGLLRVYFDSDAQSKPADVNEFHKLIEAAETLSGYICETCGKPGRAQNVKGWVRNYCKSCYEKRMNEV